MSFQYDQINLLPPACPLNEFKLGNLFFFPNAALFDLHMFYWNQLF